jgi:hypothetical protein
MRPAVLDPFLLKMVKKNSKERVWMKTTVNEISTQVQTEKGYPKAVKMLADPALALSLVTCANS